MILTTPFSPLIATTMIHYITAIGMVLDGAGWCTGWWAMRWQPHVPCSPSELDGTGRYWIALTGSIDPHSMIYRPVCFAYRVPFRNPGTPLGLCAPCSWRSGLLKGHLGAGWVHLGAGWEANDPQTEARWPTTTELRPPDGLLISGISTIRYFVG
jgi:hypothetical protein